MEKDMTKYERASEIEKLQKLKISLYDQRDVAAKTGAFLKKMSCTPDGEKMRKQLGTICKLRATRINNKINELNAKIFKLQQEEKEDFSV